MRNFLANVRYLAIIFALALAVHGILRWLLYVTLPYEFAADVTLATKITAFVRGVWFDSVICSYVTVLPLTVFCVMSIVGLGQRWMFVFARVWFGFFLGLSFFISAANIPYFCYFFQNINSSIFLWFGYAGTTAGMVVGESSYWAPLAYALAAIALLVWVLVRLPRPQSGWHRQGLVERLGVTLASVVLIGLCFLGIRGRLGYNPIKVSQAYYCNDPFLNQLGINPTFNLLTSYLDDQRKENRRLALMADDEAVRNVQQLLGREGLADVSPIARRRTPLAEIDTALANNPLRSIDLSGRNVVIVLMESMSAALMQSLDGSRPLTPFLDSLWHESVAFRNMYSAGNHTNHGMYATLYSWPAIMFRNLMKGSVIPRYSGLPTVLHDNGYHNFFFMTHESQYDNMNGFFRTNGFDEIYAQEDYPADKVVNSFGVQDDFLYGYAVRKLSDYVAAQGDSAAAHPFFSVLLSISNHPPYVIPKDFPRRSAADDEAIVEYADWSLRQLFDEARRQPWFDNTVFVLLGDHGKLMKNPECELPNSYNHIPLIIYGTGIEPYESAAFALQEDVAPTLLSMLRLSYTQNSFGIDLTSEERDCVFYTGDKIVACRDSSRLFLYNPSEQAEFRYAIGPNNSLERISSANEDARFDYLRNYVFSMLQCAETLVGERKTMDH